MNLKKKPKIQIYIDKFYIILLILSILILTFKLENLCIIGDESKLGYEAYYVYKSNDINLPAIGLYSYDACAYLLIPFVLFFGRTELALRIAVILVTIITTILLYYYVKKIYKRKTAIITSLLFITSPVLLTFRHIIDISFLMLFIVLFLILYNSKKKILRYLSYFVVGFSLTNIFTIIFFYISFFLVEFYNKKLILKKEYLIYLIFFLIGFSQFFIINIIRNFNPLFSLFALIKTKNQEWSILDFIRMFIYRNVEISYILSMGHIFWAVYGEPVSLFKNPSSWPSVNDFTIGMTYILFIVSVFFSLYKRQFKYVSYIFITVLLLSLFKISNFGARHLVMILPLFFIPIGFFISNLWKDGKNIKFLILSILAVSILFGFYYYSQAEESCYDRAADIYKIIKGYNGKMMMFSNDCGNSYNNMLYFFNGEIQHVGYSSCDCTKDIKDSSGCFFYVGSEQDILKNISSYLDQEDLRNYNLIVDVTGTNMPSIAVKEKLDNLGINYTEISGETKHKLSYYETKYAIFIIKTLKIK